MDTAALSSDVDTQVLVVGAGPTGLLLAIELRRRGVECTLIDSRDAPLHWDRATIVHPRSLEAFASLGIAERFLEVGVHQRGIRLYSDGELLGELDLGECGSPFGFNVNLSEEVTESILEEHLRTHEGSVRRGCKLIDLDQGEDRVLATIEQEGEQHEIAAAWVVGCDGLHSPTRELSGIGFEGHDIPDPWAVFDVTLDGWVSDFDFNFGFFERTPVILTPLPGRRWRVYLRPSSPTSDLVEDAAAVIGRYDPGAALLEIANPTRFHCHTKVADRYREGRVLIAGDAAHVCTPAEGHGMNSGLGDAFNLGWKLALVCQGVAAEALLDSYGEERRPVALTITASGDAAEDMLTLTEADARAARDLQLREAFTDPDARHHEVVAEVELNISYAGSAIVSGESAQLAAGARLPDELVDGRAGHTLLVLARGAGEGDRLPLLLDELGEWAAGTGLFDAVLALSTDGGADGEIGTLDPALAERLGVEDVTVLAVRPDGHVGLRSDGVEIAPLGDYVALVQTGGAQPHSD